MAKKHKQRGSKEQTMNNAPVSADDQNQNHNVKKQALGRNTER